MSSDSSSSSASSSAASSPSPLPSPPPPASSLKRRRGESIDDESDSDSDSNGSDDEITEDVPVLSHAEQRREKKRAKLDAKAAKVSSKKIAKSGKQPGEDAASKSRQNSVWIGNLSFRTTVDDLRTFFDGVGEITRVNLPTKPGTKGENRGFAYVDFATSDAKTVAITLSEKNLHGRRLLIKNGDDFTGRPASEAVLTNGDNAKLPQGLSKSSKKILASQKKPPAPTLFLGNLPFETTDHSIRGLFEAHRDKGKPDNIAAREVADQPPAEAPPVVADVKEGTAKQGNDLWIRKIRMGTFEDSGLCKGFAFVDFTSIDHATSALVNPRNHRLNGRDLVVEFASADAVRRGGGPRPKLEGENGPRGRGPAKRPKPFQRKGPGTAFAAQKNAERKKQEAEEASMAKTAGPHGDTPSSQPYKERKGADDRKPYKARSKPGAALALAKRESAAIIPAQGKKTVF